MAVKENRAITAAHHSRYHMSNMFQYKSVDGRTYQGDKSDFYINKCRYTRLRPSYEKKNDADKTVTVQNIRAVEDYLNAEKTPTSKVYDIYMKKDDNIRIAEHVFNILKKKHKAANYYLGWTDIYMSMKNRHPLRTEPLNIEKCANNETFAMDEVVQKFNIGDTVWTYFVNGLDITAEKATVDSWYYKQFRDGKCDIMYGLKSPAFGLNGIQWRLQGKNGIFDNEEDAIKKVQEMN